MTTLNFSFKTRWLLLPLMLLTLSVGQMWGAETLFSFTGSGSSDYSVPNTWSQTNVSGGSFFLFNNNGSTLTSPQYGPHNNVTLTYSVATYGSSTNHNLAVRVLNSNNEVQATYYTETPTSTTYVNTNSPINLGNINYDFKNQFYLQYAGKGVRLRNTILSGDALCDQLTMSSVTATPGDKQISLSWGSVSHADSYTVSCKVKSSGATAGSGTGSKTGTSCTITGLTNGIEYTWSVEPVGSGTYCPSNTPATGDATPNLYHTVTWNTHNGEFTTTQVLDNTQPTFPKVNNKDPESCDDDADKFYGWSTTTFNKTDDISEKTIYTSASDMSKVTTDDVVYYAVFTDAEETDYSTVYSSNVTLPNSGTNVASARVNIGSTSDIPAVKLGKSGAGASCTISIPSGTTKLYLHAAGWNGKSSTLQLSTSVGSISPNASTGLTSNSGIANNSPFTLNTNQEGFDYDDYFYEYTLSEVTSAATITITVGSERGVIWGVNAISGSSLGDGNFLTNCCKPLGSINGSVSVNNPTSVTLTWSAVTGAERYQVKVPGSSSHNDWTDVNSTSVTVTKSCGTAYTAYFRAIDTNGTHCSEGPESSLAIPAKSYTVTTTGVTHATPNTAWPATTCGNFDRTLTVATGYDFPNALTVTGADYTWVKGSGLLTIKNVIGDVSITLTPTAHNYTITYENMDGATNDANNPDTYKITDSDISLGDPTKEGYTFEGWFTNSDLAENHRVNGVAIATGSHENKTFYAKWIQKVTLTKASASHGSFVLSSSNTGSPEISSVYTNNAAQTVYVVCTPADGYEVNEVSQSGINSGVTIGGSGNSRTIEYAQGANGSSEVSVSFSCVNPSISVHPASANYAQNAEATALTVTASANSASLGYLWQSSSNNSDWSAAAGTNNQHTYTPSTATANTTYYRVIVTNNASGCESSTPSNAATITVSASVCADPTFSVSGGTYNAYQSVEISCATGGATIRYTTDGNDPTESSPVYSSAISITQTTTLKAKAFKSEWTASNITSATYTLKCAAPTFNKGTNTYLGAQEITLSCVTEGAKIYYTMDGSAPSSTNGTEYTAAITVSSNQTIKAIAVKDGWSDSDIDFATYTIQYTVTWNDNSGQIHSQAVTYGSNEYSCPSDPSLDDNCGSKFMGWTTNSTYKGNSAPDDLFTDTSGTKPTITGDTDFYAVFADYAN